MANANIFCNTPWYELHIYWDGSLGICCQESSKLYPSSNNQYNIANMTIAEWFNSEPVKALRTQVLSNNKASVCSRCYHEESVSGNSRRIKSNQKSVIFTQAFNDSFEQSPGRKHFQSHGHTQTEPIDIHVDLGNHCNLACKMCNSAASSKIAVQEVKWGIKSSKKYVGTDWTQNQAVWDSFKNQVIGIRNLKNIHVMGGETIMASRFEDLIDTFIEHKKFDVGFSFVTNGTIIKPELIQKLKNFKRLGIEVSIECTTNHNSYVRQGTDTTQVLENIQWYQSQANDSNISVTLRPAVSMLTIGYYSSLLEYALQHKLIIKSLVVVKPEFLHIRNLPVEVKKLYLNSFTQLIDKLNSVQIPGDYNSSDPHNYLINIKEEVLMCVNLLSLPTPANVNDMNQQLVEHCKKWDSVYVYNARELYPELDVVWNQHGY